MTRPDRNAGALITAVKPFVASAGPFAASAGPVAATLIVLSVLCLGGCAGTPAKQPSKSRLQAISHNQRGIAEEARGRTDLALAEFTEALRLHNSIENTDGAIVVLINLARTQRLKGDLPAARDSAERASLLLPEASPLASELFFEKAKILLASGDLPAAKEWAVRSEAAEKGSMLGGRANLVASILNRQGLQDQAREQLEKALKLNRADGSKGDEANSLRLLGGIHLAQGRDDRATQCYREALVLDKELGFGKKIAADLRGLGGAAAGRNDVAGAIGFYRRAMEVSLNGGDASFAAEDLTRLAELHRRNGEVVTAEKIDAERKKLPVR